MRRCLLLYGFLAVCLFSFSSCTSTKTVTEYVPVPVKTDIGALAQPLLSLRPSDVSIIEDVQTLSDVMQNSVSFQQSYNEWHAYADALEGFITSIDADDPPT